MTDYRRSAARDVRIDAAQKAYDRTQIRHASNGDEERYANANFAMSFTKGLQHNTQNGLIERADDFKAFRSAIDNGFVDAFTVSVPAAPNKQRKWEAPTAGLVYDLQGPDAQAVTMPPAPPLGSLELAYEMAEVYELALLRDIRLDLLSDSPAADPTLAASVSRLNAIGYDISGANGRPRKGVGGAVTPQTVFRGSSPGVEEGPYLSQFLLLGNSSVAGDGSVTSGFIRYGGQQIDQRVPIALPGVNFMVEWGDWLDVQNGVDPQSGNEADLFGPGPVSRRFISTPRDLATYVHYDALYQAYLNACLILLGMGAPSDPAFDALSGGGVVHRNSINSPSQAITRILETHPREAGGFALWGGPHILTLVTEVATRALKAVRYQKFNVHCRLRPEALAGRIHRAVEIENDFPVTAGKFTGLESSIQGTVNAIRAVNPSSTALLPMAFQEGSPMHPAYGAGHATVAGACVTILKAYFDTSALLVNRGGSPLFTSSLESGDSPVAYIPDAPMTGLTPTTPDNFLTLEGELNKLAANISIGRNMGGVHYFTDYYDSVRMGEEIAIGMLEEQALCYAQDPFVLSLTKFDGDTVRIGRR